VSRTPVSERLEPWLREAGVAFEVVEHALPAHLTADNAALRAIVGTFNASNTVSITMRCDDLVRVSVATVCRFSVCS
jgi:hypothetical protein